MGDHARATSREGVDCNPTIHRSGHSSAIGGKYAASDTFRAGGLGAAAGDIDQITARCPACIIAVDREVLSVGKEARESVVDMLQARDIERARFSCTDG